MGNFESHSQTEFGLDLSDLEIDEAYVNFASNTSEEAWIYSLSDECYGCDPVLADANPVSTTNDSTSVLNGLKISTKFPLKLFVSPNNDGGNLTETCLQDSEFGEFGLYNCTIFNRQLSFNEEEENTLQCTCTQIRHSASIYWPIVCALAFYIGLAVIWLVSTFSYKQIKQQLLKRRLRSDSINLEDNNLGIKDSRSRSAITHAISAQSLPPKPATKERVKSIDTFRGICITMMIFVNYGGGGYWFFDHSPWNGLTIPDLLFPWFMWLMGVCMPISIRSLVKRKRDRKSCYLKIAKRACWLFVLGLAISNVDNLDVVHLRICGVLQRFAFAYLIVASLHLTFHDFSRPSCVHYHEKMSMFNDVLDLSYEWVAMLCIVLFSTFLTFLLAVPGCPTGYLGPGGRAEGGQHENCTGGATGYIDRMVLGPSHCYQNPTPKAIYDTVVPFDPEGILGTIQSCFSVFLGLQCGMTLITFRKWKSRVIRWIIWGSITGCFGAIFCSASLNDGWIPVNKNLWSLSFVLVTACLASYALALFYIVIDVLHLWNGAPFFYPGMNSILLYVGHNITINVFPFQWYDSRMAVQFQTHGMQLVLDLWVATLWVIIAIWLHSIRFFVAL